MQRQFDLVYAYLALAQRPGQRAARWTSARGCWCASWPPSGAAAAGASTGRGTTGASAGLPVDLLSELGRHDASPRSPTASAPRWRWWTAVACADGGRDSAEALSGVRRHFSERAMAELDRVPGRPPPHRRRSSMSRSTVLTLRRSASLASLLAAGPAAGSRRQQARHRHRLSRRGRQPDPRRHRRQRGLSPARPAGGHVRPPAQRLGEPRGGDRLDPRRDEGRRPARTCAASR